MVWLQLASLFFIQAEDGIRDFHVTGVQTCALPISQALHELGRNARSRLGRTAADAKRPHDPTLVERMRDLVEPPLPLLLGASRQRLAQLAGETAAFVLTGGRIRRDNDRTQIAKRDRVGVGNGSLGAVEPLGGPQAGEQ